LQTYKRTHTYLPCCFGRPRKLTPHQRREAIARRDTGDESLTDIARSYNVSHSTNQPPMIDRGLEKLGVELRPRQRNRVPCFAWQFGFAF
jgi:hypothetical protein